MTRGSGPSLVDRQPWLWAKVRRVVLARDHHTCQLQYVGCTRRATQVDHKLSRMLGGSDDLDNLQAVCGWCNRMKGAAPFLGTGHPAVSNT